MRTRLVMAALLMFGLLGCRKQHGASESGQKVGAQNTAAPPPVSAPPPPAAAQPNRANAKAVNTQGMKAYKTKDYPAAAEKFRAAIAADPSFPLPHYNLACTAALTGDKDTARAELEWLAASPDPQARKTLLKAGRDSDLRSLADDPQAQRILQWSGVFPGYRALFLESDASDDDAKRLVKIAGEHPDECSSETAFTVAHAIKAELAADHPGTETLVVSLADGAVLFDATGKMVARGEPLDPECSGGSQSSLIHVSAGQVIPDDEPEFVIHSAAGGHGGGYVEQVSLLKRRGDKLVTILTANVEGSDKEEFSLEGVGTIRHRESEQKQTQIKRWDAAKFAFIATPAPDAAGQPSSGEHQAAFIVDSVNGFTADGAYFSYVASSDLETQKDEGAPNSVTFGVVLDTHSGVAQRYVLSIDGEATKQERKKYGKMPNEAAFNRWKKEHPTRCVGGRASPDGKTTADIELSGQAKKKRGSWKKDTFHFRRIDDNLNNADDSITFGFKLSRDGKAYATDSWIGNSMLEGELFGTITLCWSSDSERAAWIVKREKGMMRDMGETTIVVASVGASSPEPAK